MPAAPEAGGAIRRRVRRWSLPAAVTGAAVAFDGRSGAFALGDGSLRRSASPRMRRSTAWPCMRARCWPWRPPPAAAS
jgi:hypothetical protein